MCPARPTLRSEPRSSLLPPRMSDEERRLVRKMHFESDQSPSEIAETTGRNISSICRTLAAKGPRKKLGRPTLFTKKKVATSSVQSEVSVTRHAWVDS